MAPKHRRRILARMKDTSIFERVLRAAANVERETGAELTVSAERFCEATARAARTFLPDDDVAVIRHTRDGIVVHETDDGSRVVSCAAEEGWVPLLGKNKVAAERANDGALVDGRYESWMLVPAAGKQEAKIAAVVARRKGKFHRSEIDAATGLSSFLGQAWRGARTRSKRAATLAEDARHASLLSAQAAIARNQDEWPGLSRAVDYGSGAGSDFAKAYRSGEYAVLACVCDVTAEEGSRLAAMVHVDCWLSILAQTSLEARAMLRRISLDLAKGREERYAAIALVRHNRETGATEIAGCGNVGAVVFSHETMDARRIEFAQAAGIVPEGEIVAHSLVSRPGDVVCVYSDGVSGAKKRNGELFGDEAVVDIVRKGYYLSAADLASAILRAVSEREERGANADDRTVQVLKIE